MKKILNYSTIAFLLISLFVLSQESQAQLRGYGLKLGLQANYINAANEFEDDGLSFMIRSFGRYELSDLFHLEGGVGFGQLQGLDYGGNDYMTRLVPFDARLLVTPFDLKSWNPYVYAGIGMTYWWLADSPKFPSRPTFATDGIFESFVETGLGTEIALSPNWILDVAIGFTVVNSDQINGLISNVNDEFLHEYDRYYNLGVGVAYVFEGCDSDADNDGLGKCQEEELGLDPNNPDTDGDGLNDGDELMKYNTDPKNADTDGDGLNDKAEIFTYETDPNKADTDGDGLNDGQEVNSTKTDPKNADTDGDNLSDGEEVNKYKTNPNKKDTDGDNLNDGDEVKIHKTNPLKKDTDGDNLTDGEEVNKYKTNPLVMDTDKGSVNDGDEVKNGTDPLNPDDDVMKAIKELVLDPVRFATDSDKIRSSEEGTLKKALMHLIDYPNVNLLITGYADSRGKVSYNLKLSERRANSVKKWFLDKGLNKDRFIVKAYGEKNPVANNSTKAGQTENRRVELKIEEIK